MRYFVLAALLLLSPSIAKATIQPSDFAYGMPISIEKGGAVYRFSVPREVYETVVLSDLNDIRIFNSAKVAVPHTLRKPRKKIEIPEIIKRLPFFPLFRTISRTEKDNLSVRIEKDGDGTIINVESSNGETGEERTLSGYIIDASKYEKPIHKLDITWLTEEENFITTITVEYSDDLTNWSSLVPRATLARMKFSGHKINIKRIQLPVKTANYFRLSWPIGRKGIEVKQMLAIMQSGKPEKENIWFAISGKHKPDDTKTKIKAYEYDSTAQLPVDRIRLRFHDKNTLVKATIYSRTSLEEEWHQWKKAIFYDLDFDQATLLQDTVTIGQTSDRYWRVEFEGDTSGDSGSLPILKLGWLPHELLFVAQGEGPFMLAYGSAIIGKEELNNNTTGLLAHVMGEDEDGLLKEATLLPKMLLGGSDQLTPEPLPLPWRKWLLWGVLAMGVGIIAKMAMSLGKVMNKAKDT